MCWICGAPADSREHKIKRSDLVREFGGTPFKATGGLLHFVDGRPGSREVQGPNTGLLKYNPVLCGNCNSSLSQPWNLAYDQFTTWVFENEQTVLSKRYINLMEIYGTDDISLGCRNLYKYFVKAFGCRLADAERAVPPHLVDLLAADTFSTNLWMSFAVNKAVFAMRPEHRKLLAIGGLWYNPDATDDLPNPYYFSLRLNWLEIEFWYDMDIPPGRGARWTCDAACLYLGEIEGPDLNELIEIARRDGAPALQDLLELKANGGIRIGNA